MEKGEKTSSEKKSSCYKALDQNILASNLLFSELWLTYLIIPCRYAIQRFIFLQQMQSLTEVAESRLIHITFTTFKFHAIQC